MDVTRSRCGLGHRRQGDGVPVLLVHGIPGAGGGWAGVMARLPRGMDVIAPDLVGFGSTDRPPAMTIEVLGPPAQAAALAGLMDELSITNAVVVGHDFGAPVSILLAASRPDLVSALFVMAGNTFPDTPIPFPLSLTTAPLIGPLVARALFSRASLHLMLRQGTGPGSQPPDPGVYLGDGTQRAAIAAIFSAALTRLEDLYRPVEAALRHIDVPVVVGWGDRDPFFSIEQGHRTAAAGRGQLHVFNGAGHFLPHERPAEVAQQIEKIVADARS